MISVALGPDHAAPSPLLKEEKLNGILNKEDHELQL